MSVDVQSIQIIDVDGKLQQFHVGISGRCTSTMTCVGKRGWIPRKGTDFDHVLIGGKLVEYNWSDAYEIKTYTARRNDKGYIVQRRPRTFIMLPAALVGIHWKFLK